ncbi:hypothetical protein V5O48_001182 [Marasmius crinis-equi]|uniref:F-box domain-containing protein n=1 Tax=Marasmius crinis-equi TaxID=585013 RepID=A0ABR3FZR4_9AGAR
MPPTIFMRLPTEIVEQIALESGGGDLKNFRLTNRHANEGAERILWRTHAMVLELDPFSWRSFATLQELSNVGNSSQFTYGSIRILEIATPHFRISPTEEAEVLKNSYARMLDILPKALSSLQGVTVARWKFSDKDPEGSQNTIVEALSTLPSLTNVTLEGQRRFDVIPHISVPSFTKGLLNELTLRGACNGPRHLTSWLSTLLAHNPSVPLHLQSLRLKGWQVDFSTPEVLRHIRSLSSLECDDVLSIGMWEPLQSKEIVIRNITCHSITRDLIAYLESFSGLEQLITSRNLSESPEDAEWAGRFYRRTLPIHRSTLRNLKVGAVSWAIGLADVGVFEGFQGLRALSVSLKIDDIHPGQNGQDLVAVLIIQLVRLPLFRLLDLRDGQRKSYATFDDYGLYKTDEHTIRKAIDLFRVELCSLDLPQRSPGRQLFCEIRTPMNRSYTSRTTDDGFLTFLESER